jgi:hypothetical protein
MQKTDKDKILSLKEAISKAETELTIATSEGNKRAADSAKRCIEGYKKLIEKLKAK